MEDFKAQIKLQSSSAAKFSKEAVEAATARNFATAKALIQQAVAAGRNCQKLIEQYNRTSKLKNKG
jgi:Tol biopolymer transport system component